MNDAQQMQRRERALVCHSSDHKWFRNLAISQIIVETMEAMGVQIPQPTVNIADIRRKYHQAAAEPKGSKPRVSR